MYSDVMPWSLEWRGLMPVVKRPAVCEACGEPFACELSASGCWCSAIELSDAKRAEIRAKYTHCLCPTCLRQYAAGDERSAGPPALSDKEFSNP